MDANALIIFTDVRGFTSWARDTEVFARLNEFVDGFLAIIRRQFPEPTFVKGLGDGAMIVREIDEATTASVHAKLLTQTLETIHATEQEFQTLCEQFAQKVGQQTKLRLGRGIVRGPVKKQTHPQDFVGPNANKAARLCDAVRPFGIVIDASDFTSNPASKRYRFFKQTRKLSGAGEVEAWVTEEIVSRFVVREKLRETPEVHVAGVCIVRDRKAFRLLIARRSPNRSLYPNLFEGCGGQLARSESFIEGVRRHFRLEFGLDVRPLADYHCFYEIKLPDDPLIPGIRFLCQLVGDPPESIASANHSEVRWVSEKEFRKMPSDQFVETFKDEVLGLLGRYRKNDRS